MGASALGNMGALDVASLGGAQFLGTEKDLGSIDDLRQAAGQAVAIALEGSCAGSHRGFGADSSASRARTRARRGCRDGSA